MNHQPFRDWMLSEEQLTADQTAMLKEHLQSCQSCSGIEAAWIEVESVIHKIDQVIPAPGFTERWQTHLAEYQQHKQARKGWLTIGFTVLIVTSLLGLLVAQLVALFQAPGPYLAALFNRLIGLISIYYTLSDIVSPFRWDLSIYSFVGMFFLVGMICFISVFWLATYRKLSMARRVI